MKRRPRRRYRAIRRVPQAYPGLYLRLKVAPIVPALAATVAVGALADISALPQDVRARARSLSDDMGTAISEKSQRIFFDTPGLDTLLIRSLSHVARRTATVGRAWARAVVAARRGQGRAHGPHAAPHPQARIRRPHDRHADDRHRGGRPARRRRSTSPCCATPTPTPPSRTRSPATPRPKSAASTRPNCSPTCAPTSTSSTGRALSAPPSKSPASARTRPAAGSSPWSAPNP